MVKTLHSGGKVSTTLMGIREAKNHKNQSSNNVTVLKDSVTMEFYQEYLENTILKTKNHLPLRKKIWYNLPAIKQRLETITKSNISKEAWFVIRGITIIVIASIIITALK
jgi:hypothetical protein